jgi:hypothetical protein
LGLSKDQQAIHNLARPMGDITGNPPPMPGIFSDY